MKVYSLMNPPAISVIMSAYNADSHITEAIKSILSQSFSDFEFIIIDDCSTDNTAQIIQSFAEKDTRIRFIHNQENLGLTRSLNKGISIASGEFIARQDADDISYPERLETQLKAMQSRPKLALVSSYFDIVDEQGDMTVYKHMLSEIEQRWEMLFYNHISGHSGVMLRRDVMQVFQGYDENYRFAQDYELWQRMLAEHPFFIIPQALFCIHFHHNNISRKNLEAQQKTVLSIIHHQFEQMIGQISLVHAQDLHLFWLQNFLNISDYSRLNHNLWRIWKAFLSQQDSSPIEEKIIRRKIASRLWASAPVSNRRFLQSLSVLQWSPTFFLKKMLSHIKFLLISSRSYE